MTAAMQQQPAEAVRKSADDRRWEAALAELTSEGVLAPAAAAQVRQRRDELATAQQARSRRAAVVELAGYVGAALVVASVATLAGELFGRFDESARFALLSVLALVVVAAAAALALLAPGGLAGLRSERLAWRRRLVAVLGVVGALLTTGAAAAGIGLVLPQYAVPDWILAAFAFGLLVACCTAGAAPGVVATLGVLGLGLGTVLAAANTFGSQDAWVPLAAVLVAAMAGALLLVRWLRPAVLVEALSIAAWLNAAGIAMGLDAGGEVARSDAATAHWIGRAAIVLLIVLGAVRTLRGGTWPWAAGAAIGTALFVQLTFAGALGGALAMLAAGVVLLAVSLVLARARRRPRPAAGAPGPSG